MSDTTIEAVAESPTPSQTRTRSVWAVMADVFIEPSRAFKTTAGKPRWLVPFVIIVLAVFGQLLVTNEIRMDDLARQIRNNQTMAPEEAARRLANIEAQRSPEWHWSGLAHGLGFVALGKGAQLLPMAALIWLGLQFSIKRPRFRHVLAVCTLAMLIALPEAALSSAMAFVKGTTEITLGPAVLLPQAWKHSPLYRLCFQIDIFTVWTVILLIIGLPVATGVSRRLAAVTVGYLWVVWLLIAMFVGRLVQIT